jgi:pimeloyl-ACP methyl ester carboxylesterase
MTQIMNNFDKQGKNMKTKLFRIISIFMLVVLVLVLGTAVAGAVAKSNLAKQNPAPGRLVDVGGYRLHLNCVGEGSPTIILEAGQGDYSLFWAYVQPEIAKTNRVCSYDRAGYGWSETSPHPRTSNSQVKELHTLLVNAEVEGPYVLVGHSLGGMLVRVYAHNYADEVVGMVLVDSFHEERYVRIPELLTLNQKAAEQMRMFSILTSTGIMALVPQSIPNRGLPADAYAQYQAITATTGYFESFIAEVTASEERNAEARALHMTSLGNMPLIVLSAGHGDAVASFSDAENQNYLAELQVEQSELAALSSNAQLVIAEQSGHNIQLDQPDLVIDAVRQIIEATQ